jgi:hypothetical protein
MTPSQSGISTVRELDEDAEPEWDEDAEPVIEDQPIAQESQIAIARTGPAHPKYIHVNAVRQLIRNSAVVERCHITVNEQQIVIETK